MFTHIRINISAVKTKKLSLEETFSFDEIVRLRQGPTFIL